MTELTPTPPKPDLPPEPTPPPDPKPQEGVAGLVDPPQPPPLEDTPVRRPPARDLSDQMERR